MNTKEQVKIQGGKNKELAKLLLSVIEKENELHDLCLLQIDKLRLDDNFADETLLEFLTREHTLTNRLIDAVRAIISEKQDKLSELKQLSKALFSQRTKGL